MSDNPALTLDLHGMHALDASAGTGKTYSIALIFLRLVLKGIRVERILVTTFTNAAAAELRERLRLRLGEAREGLAAGLPDGEDRNLAAVLASARATTDKNVLAARLDNALSCFDLAPICTIHGFCNRLRKDHALELGATVDSELVAEDPHLGQLAGDFLAKLACKHPVAGLGEKAPEVRDLLTIARKMREYELPAPGCIPLELLENQTQQKWRAEVMECLQQANKAWSEQRAGIEKNIQKLLNDGALQPEAFKTPKILDNSISDTGKLLSDPFQGELKFSAGVKRMRRQDLLKQATDQGLSAVTTFIETFNFFEYLEELVSMPVKLDSRLEAVQTRFLEQEFIESAAKPAPDGTMLYSDLINVVYRSLENGQFPAAVRSLFDAVMVDECQDTDARQLEIFRKLFANPEWVGNPADHLIVWVGDPKQSIYRFRGADIDTYISAKANAIEKNLDTNFRSDAPLVAAINALFLGASGPVKPVFGHNVPFTGSVADKTVNIRLNAPGDVPAFCLHTWSSPGDTPSKSAKLRPALIDCANSIKCLLDSGVEINSDGWRRVKAGDIAVLAPEGKQLEIVRRQLQRLGIPSAYQTDSSVYLEKEALDMGLLLQALASPRPHSIRASLATPFFGYTLYEVVQMPEPEFLRLQTRILDLAERVRKEGFMSVLFSLLRDGPPSDGPRGESALVRLARLPEGERILTNILQLGELLQAAWDEAHARSPEALKDFLDQAMSRAAAGQAGDGTEAAKLRLETDAPAVILSTIHTSKGLQYPIVFLPAMWAQKAVQTPPCLVSHENSAAILRLPGDEAWDQALKNEKERLDTEQMRLLYVALTRAKHQVHAWWGRVKHEPRWTVSSTRAAFGRLLFEEPKGAELYKDEDCLNAFEVAMSRYAGTTSEVIQIGDRFAWCKPVISKEGAASGILKQGDKLSAAKWTRVGLGAAPLQSSYSALLRRNPDAHRAEDETQPPLSESDAGIPAEPVEDILEPFQGGTVLGDRVHYAFEMAMSGGDAECARNTFIEALKSDLPGLLRGDRTVPDFSGTAGALWDRTAGASLASGTISDLLKEPHSPEWEFMLPQDPRLTPEGLAAIMEKYGAGSPWGETTYVSRIKSLGFTPLSGYFEGIIDLMGRLRNGQWVVADYKTNRLDGYGDRNLNEAMAECHYLLQALLYAVAARRWLRKSVPGWDYERHFCGTAYLFLRGMKEGTHQGIWLGKPPAALVEALDELFPAKRPVAQ